MKKILFIVLSLMGAYLCYGQEKEELEQQKQKMLQEIEQTRTLLSKTATQKRSSLDRLQLVQKGIHSRESLIYSIEKEIEMMNLEIAEKEREIEEYNHTLAKQKEEYESIVYSVYKRHTDYEMLMYLLASKTIGQAYQRIKYVKYLGEYRRNTVKEIEHIKSELEKQKVLLGKKREEKLNLLEEKESESRKLIGEQKRRKRIIRELEREENRLRSELNQKEKIRNELEAEIERLIAEEARRANTGNIYNSLTPEQRLTGENFTENRGRMPWPVERGVVTGKFGEHAHPVLRGVTVRNNGIDITSERGTKARAIFDGEVTRVIAILGANYTVLIRHGEYLTVYQNLVNVRVKKGDNVLAKQVIGDIYNEEESEVAVLHLEIWKERKKMDPEKWLSN